MAFILKCKQISSLSLKQCFGVWLWKKKIGISRKEIKLMLEAKRIISGHWVRELGQRKRITLLT